ncbi:MAG TPA: hypothetical protein VLB27_02490, partial [candidate division Zixibacteria bacterium]|nr:hypothetical protein [candidate division Zixibacteria bacterium]
MPADSLSPAEALAQAKRGAGIHSFKIVGADGALHSYDCTPHGFDGADWCLEVAAAVGVPLAKLAQGHLLELFNMFMADDAENALEADMQAVIKKLDAGGDLNLAGSIEHLFSA